MSATYIYVLEYRGKCEAIFKAVLASPDWKGLQMISLDRFEV
jgi:hypothetical protein